MPTETRPTGHTVRFCVIVTAVTILAILIGTSLMTAQAGATSPPSADQVKQAQYVLTSHGYAVGPVDGVLGPRTRSAVAKWQQSNRLYVDGIPGPVTLSSLVASVPATAGRPAVRVNPPAPQAARSVEQIIRDAWPDDLEDHALAIVSRETGRTFDPTVINPNGDATGLFQIMWSVHRRWLCPELGVCAQSQLQDADTNARAAFALYLRDRGWGPWAT